MYDFRHIYSVAQADYLTPQEFEALVAYLFRERGYSTRLSGRSGDKGVDIELMRSGRMSIVQCKRWRGNVGDDDVMKLLGSLYNTGSAEAFLVTTSDFTPQARATARRHTDVLTLVNGNLLDQWIRKTYFDEVGPVPPLPPLTNEQRRNAQNEIILINRTELDDEVLGTFDPSWIDDDLQPPTRSWLHWITAFLLISALSCMVFGYLADRDFASGENDTQGISVPSTPTHRSAIAVKDPSDSASAASTASAESPPSPTLAAATRTPRPISTRRPTSTPRSTATSRPSSGSFFNSIDTRIEAIERAGQLVPSGDTATAMAHLIPMAAVRRYFPMIAQDIGLPDTVEVWVVSIWLPSDLIPDEAQSQPNTSDPPTDRFFIFEKGDGAVIADAYISKPVLEIMGSLQEEYTSP